jgi:hypothetical protein
MTFRAKSALKWCRRILLGVLSGFISALPIYDLSKMAGCLCGSQVNRCGSVPSRYFALYIVECIVGIDAPQPSGFGLLISQTTL